MTGRVSSSVLAARIFAIGLALVPLPLFAAPVSKAPSSEAPSTASLSGDPRVASALELARIWLEAERVYERIPALSVEIVHDQEVLFSGGFGYADLATARPASADTIYSICSLSKLFTAIAVMQQRDAGRLRLDDPVARHLSWFRAEEAGGAGEPGVTIEGLLTHASGLPQEPAFAYWSAPAFAFPTHDELVAKLAHQPVLFAPERFFQYSNLGFTLAGEIVAASSGEPYARWVGRNILEPLSLGSTTPELPESERGKRMATGYSAIDRDGRRNPVPFFQTRAVAPAAGYASTVIDLGRFAAWQFRLLRQGGTEVLSAPTLREMHRVHWIEPDYETAWGLGFRSWRDDGKTFVGHEGECPGFRSAIAIEPAGRIASIVLANANGVEPRDWAQRLYDIVAPALRQAIESPGKGVAPSPALRRYAGSYGEQPWGGEVAIFPWEDGLASIELPTMSPVKNLTLWKRSGDDRFRRVRKDGELAEEIVFEMGPDGRPSRLVWQNNYNPRLPDLPRERGAPTARSSP